MADVCGDNRFELIKKYRNKLIEATNIEDSPEEMKVLNDILFRFWQMDWLDKLEMTSFIDKSNFDIKQYIADNEAAYQCGYHKGASETLDKMKKAREEIKALDAEYQHFADWRRKNGLYEACKILEKYIKEGE